MTSQQLKEELQESRGFDQIFIPQKNQRFAEGLTKTGNTAKHVNAQRDVLCMHINKLKYDRLFNVDKKRSSCVDTYSHHSQIRL